MIPNIKADGILLADRIQYCHAEADMDRWQEQWECCQAQFLNFIVDYRKCRIHGDDITKTCTRGLGYTAAARKMAATYSLMLKNAKATLTLAGYQPLLDLDLTTLLADYMVAGRQDPELAWVRVLKLHKLPPPKLNDGELFRATVNVPTDMSFRSKGGKQGGLDSGMRWCRVHALK